MVKITHQSAGALFPIGAPFHCNNCATAFELEDGDLWARLADPRAQRTGSDAAATTCPRCGCLVVAIKDDDYGWAKPTPCLLIPAKAPEEEGRPLLGEFDPIVGYGSGRVRVRRSALAARERELGRPLPPTGRAILEDVDDEAEAVPVNLDDTDMPPPAAPMSVAEEVKRQRQSRDLPGVEARKA